MATVTAWIRGVLGRMALDPKWATALSVVLFVGTVTVAGAASAARQGEETVAVAIRRLLADPARTPAVGGALLREADALRAFYSERRYAPIWAMNEPHGSAVRPALAGVADDALDPGRYHTRAIDSLMSASATTAATAAALDLLRTDGLLAAARDLATGRVDPRALHAGWRAPPRPFDAASTLERIAAGEDPARVLEALRPAAAAYRRTADTFARYRALGDAPWPAVADARLALGDSGDAVVALRRRLAAEMGPGLGGSGLFDDDLAATLRAWQAARGLESDGIVGPRTRAQLRIAPAARARQLSLALERLRWEALGSGMRVEVRIPAFDLRVLDGERALLSMPVIAGRADWPTPVFDATIEAVIVSPYWNVPARIAALEVLPAVRRDRSYLTTNHMRILAANGRIIDPARIDWANVDARDFAYRFRQEPGPDNPLGGIKFLLPNPYDVYLHDTNAPSLFARADRARSHGCVRLAEPMALALLLLRGTPWDREAIAAAVAVGKERWLALPHDVPVHVRYTTAWVEADGTVAFRPDLYGHDTRLAARLADDVAVTAAAAVESCDGTGAGS